MDPSGPGTSERKVTNPGRRYDLGYIEGQYYAIWDRGSTRLVEQFPLTDEGWATAWRQWQASEGGGTEALASPGQAGWGAPVTQPSVAAQYQDAWGRPETLPATRPGGVTTAAVLLIILGALACLLGVILVIGAIVAGSALEEAGFGNIGGAATGVLAVLAVLVLGFGIAQIISGARVLKLSNGWRVTGIVLTSLEAVLFLFGVIGAFARDEEIDSVSGPVRSTGPDVGSIIFSLIFLVACVITIVLLAKNGRAFKRA
jgi:hypothetical protein